ERRPRILRGSRRAGLALEPARTLGRHGAHEVVLGGEAAVDRALAHAGPGGDLGDDGVLALLGEDLGGGGDHPRAVADRVGPRAAAGDGRDRHAQAASAAGTLRAIRPRRLGINVAVTPAASATPALTRNAAR